MSKLKQYLTRKSPAFLVLVFVFFAFPIVATATPPANDNLANAQSINGASGSVGATTVEATVEESEPTHTFDPLTRTYKTVWFQWTPSVSKPVTFAASATTFDASMAIYTGSGFPLESLGMNNDTAGTDPRIEFFGEAGVTYKIAVGIYNQEAHPGGAFTFSWAQTDAPTNDNFAQAINLAGTSGSRAVSNRAATTEASEPSFGVGNTIWFTFTNNTAHDFSLSVTTENSFDAFLDTKLAVFTGSSPGSLTPVVKNTHLPTTSKSRVTFLARVGVTYRIMLDSGTVNGARPGLVDWNVTSPLHYTDFGTDLGNSEIHYDECADLAVFRPSDGYWYSLDSSTGTFRAFKFGQNGDKPVPADFDGDGLTDYAVTRTTGGVKIWHIRSGFDGSYRSVQWGLGGDREVPGDFDADGRADLAVFRPSNNVWYVLRSSDGQFLIKEFGLAGDVPVLGDFKGTPAGDDLAVFRPSTGTWFIFDGTNTIFAPFGMAGDIPVPARYDLDARTDLAVFRPSTGEWYYLQSQNNIVRYLRWGISGDIPMPGDFDRLSNNLADFIVYRPTDNVWYVNRSEETAQDYRKFGTSGDIPVSSFVP